MDTLFPCQHPSSCGCILCGKMGNMKGHNYVLRVWRYQGGILCYELDMHISDEVSDNDGIYEDDF
jgi:hypothetical protein